MKTKIIVLVILITLAASSYAATFDATKPWHPLLQVSGNHGSTSVDANDDGL